MVGLFCSSRDKKTLIEDLLREMKYFVMSSAIR